MSKNNCKTVQRELDELNLGDDVSPLAATHLLDCEACRDFQEKQNGLRRLVGSLGTVEAPADFDFRLRARLARTPMPTTYQLSANRLPLSQLVAIAAVILLFVGAVGFLRYIQLRQSTTPVIAGAPPRVETAPVAPPEPTRNPEKMISGQTDAVANNSNQSRPSLPAIGIAPKSKRQLVAADFSNTQATTFGPSNSLSNSRVFPIDVSTQSMKLSLDDGRGNARTISLPGVSFGSQRVLANSNQFAPKDVW